MKRNENNVSASGMLLLMLVLANAAMMEKAMVSDNESYWLISAGVTVLLGALAKYNDIA